MITQKDTIMIQVKDPGFFTSVQDLGRYGYRHFGVPVSGVADTLSASRVNALLENDPADALLEMTMQGATLEFLEPTFICLGGALMEVELDRLKLEPDQVYSVKPNQILRCGRTAAGLRTYLGIRGGIKTQLTLGSRSYFKGITTKGQISKGDQLEYLPDTTFEPKILKWRYPNHIELEDLDCFKGPEFELISFQNQELILNKSFTIGKEFNRMGCQLAAPIQEHNLNIITSATIPGTVQLTPSGKLIVLLCDGQTTGGYPRVLQLSQHALSILAQKRYGDSIKFRLNTQV
ncbi:MAG: hypothetical protein RLZZ241_1848 [Bacteroidota bacterium]|jgi:biotin-dependent carboxylase-like uncharacterized protein